MSIDLKINDNDNSHNPTASFHYPPADLPPGCNLHYDPSWDGPADAVVYPTYAECECFELEEGWGRNRTLCPAKLCHHFDTNELPSHNDLAPKYYTLKQAEQGINTDLCLVSQDGLPLLLHKSMTKDLTPFFLAKDKFKRLTDKHKDADAPTTGATEQSLSATTNGILDTVTLPFSSSSLLAIRAFIYQPTNIAPFLNMELIKDAFTAANFICLNTAFFKKLCNFLSLHPGHAISQMVIKTHSWKYPDVFINKMCPYLLLPDWRFQANYPFLQKAGGSTHQQGTPLASQLGIQPYQQCMASLANQWMMSYNVPPDLPYPSQCMDQEG